MPLRATYVRHTYTGRISWSVPMPMIQLRQIVFVAFATLPSPVLTVHNRFAQPVRRTCLYQYVA